MLLKSVCRNAPVVGQKVKNPLGYEQDKIKRPPSLDLLNRYASVVQLDRTIAF